MATYTDAQMLEIVQTAIGRLIAGSQEYAVGEFRYKRADLPALVAYEARLKNRLAASISGGGVTLAEF